MRYNYTLILLLIFSLASCGLVNKPQAGVYAVSSDCPEATTSGTIDFGEADFILLDAFEAENAQDFGFPENTFFVAGSKMTSQAGERDCSAVIFEDAASSLLFACKEDEKVVCSIHLEKGALVQNG